jgi:hypothetical protein
MFYNKEYKIYFVKKVNGTYQLVKTKKLKEMQKAIKLENRAYVIDYALCYMQSKNISIYMLDYDSGNQLINQAEIPTDVNPIDLDVFLSNKIIRELANSVIADKKSMIIGIIVGAIIGALAVFAIASQYYNSQIEALDKIQNTSTIPVYTTTLTIIRMWFKSCLI